MVYIMCLIIIPISTGVFDDVTIFEAAILLDNYKCSVYYIHKHLKSLCSSARACLTNVVWGFCAFD